MTAISTGAPAQNPLQALSRLLPTGKSSPPTAPKRTNAPAGLQFVTTPDGNTTAYKNGRPVAWIVPGYHRSRETGTRCEFVDVAYHRKTQHGINMETADFLTMEDALGFIRETFRGAPKSAGFSDPVNCGNSTKEVCK